MAHELFLFSNETKELIMFIRVLPLLLSSILCILFSCFGPFDPNNPYQGIEDSDNTNTNTSNNSVTDSSIISFWDFNDSGNSILEDLSENNNHGKIEGCKWVKGLKGYALSFNGVDDYVEFDKYTLLNLDLSDFTISLFVKVNAPSNTTDSFYYDIISKGERCKSGFTISATKNKILGQITNTGCSINDSVSIADGNWHHIALVRRSGNGYLYFDAKSIENYPSNDTISTLTKLKFGKNGSMDNSFYAGLLDEVKIIKTGWTESQVKSEYNSCL